MEYQKAPLVGRALVPKYGVLLFIFTFYVCLGEGDITLQQYLNSSSSRYELISGGKKKNYSYYTAVVYLVVQEQ